MSSIDSLLDPIPLPPMVAVRQRFERPVVADIEQEITAQLEARKILASLKPGQSVAITAGSRGIVNLPLAIRTVVRAVKKTGAVPFIVPAMGSHGGATAEGQVKLLKGLGIDEETVEAPLRSSMETVRVGTTDTGLPAMIDKYAAEADATIVINRVKAHTSFRGEYESGLLKMITIGLGKQQGADLCHRLGFGHMAKNVPDIARVILDNSNIIGAVAILENGYHETARVEVLPANEIFPKEPELLREYWRISPRIPFDVFDVLVLDYIGKDIAGTGFDTNIVGRYNSKYATGGPAISRVAVLNITDFSKGNANGIGLADFTTQRAFNKFLPEQTYPNSLTSTVPDTVRMPMVLKNDKQAIQAAVKTCNSPTPESIKLVRLQSTLCLDEFFISEALIPECQKLANVEICGRPEPFAFSATGNLLD